MLKFKLLILDANVVISLHTLGLWNVILQFCEVHLSRIVFDEAIFYKDDAGTPVPINLESPENKGAIKIFEVKLDLMRELLNLFDSVYISAIHAGEQESLSYLYHSKEVFLISSGDAIVYKVLGCLGLGERGISLEEILQKIGRSRQDLEWRDTKRFREKYTLEGQKDSVVGRGRKATAAHSAPIDRMHRPRSDRASA